MDISNLAEEDRTFIKELKSQWLKGSFLSCITRGSEPTRNILGKIKHGHQWDLSESECVAYLTRHLPKHIDPTTLVMKRSISFSNK